MTVRDLLKQGSEKIAPRWPGTPVLDASVLLRNILGIEREKLLSSYDMKIESQVEDLFNSAVEKRVNGFPIAYITGKKEFFGLDFVVADGILIPRADTEILVETIIEAVSKNFPEQKISILDLCTGSGCIAIALKKNFPTADIDASDLSDISEKIFKKNCFNLNEKEIRFIKSDLFENIGRKYDIIVSNPPYLTDEHVDEMISINWPEPESALRGGRDGLDFIRKITEEAVHFLKKGGLLAYEADPSQMDSIKTIMEKNRFSGIKIIEDLAGRKRIITGNFLSDEQD
jgi:release factor-specific protein-(glutamine-N5) methyltransferase